MTTKNRRPPLPPPEAIAAIRAGLVAYWNAIAVDDEVVGVLGDLVRETEVKVTELLATGNPYDVIEASSNTAEFELRRRSSS